jgi:murein L,D-transpeptidase YcbB/YkuD
MTHSPKLLPVALCLGVLLSIASCSSPLGHRTAGAVPPRVTRLIATPGAAIGGEPLLQRTAVEAFYRARENRAAWDPDAGATSIRGAIADIAKDGLDPADYHLARIDALIAARKASPGGDNDADLEVLLTDAVAAMIDESRYGRVLPATLDSTWNVNSRKGAPPLAEALARVAAASSPADGIEKEKLDHFVYRGLKDELARLTAIAQKGGWATIPAGRVAVPGARDPRMPLVRARMAATGELASGNASAKDSLLYDGDLGTAVKLFQQRHRLDQDGKLDATTLAAMNVPVASRINQVKVNLERSRWVLPGLAGDFLLVNLPAFKAYLIRDQKNVWETRTQVGKEVRQTPTFRADMKFAIFNPTWTVPTTILREDVIGGFAKGKKDVLTKHNLKVYDKDGKEVDPSSIDWKSANADNFPYTLRQDAGDDNALGRLKFMFPNPYDIYLHDTPSRELFAAEKRTFSSGCIRIEDPLGLAQQVLGDQGYDAAKVEATIAAGKTTQVNLTKPLPVLIVYWTTSVGATGEVHWAPDVYDRDPPVLAALAAPSRNGGRAQAR